MLNMAFFSWALDKLVKFPLQKKDQEKMDTNIDLRYEDKAQLTLQVTLYRGIWEKLWQKQLRNLVNTK